MLATNERMGKDPPPATPPLPPTGPNPLVTLTDLLKDDLIMFLPQATAVIVVVHEKWIA
jgi:hypothetical protein